MIVVRLELWPQGDHGRRRTLAVAEIVNTGGTAAAGSYAASFYRSGNAATKNAQSLYQDRINLGRVSEVPWRSGTVGSFKRKRLGAWHLLLACLRSALESSPVPGGEL